MPSLFDTHCHLTLGALKVDGRAAWQRAQAAGVGRALIVGIDAETSKEVVEFVQHDDGLFASVGIHPNDSAKVHDGDWESIQSLAHHEKVVALGETGIDLYWKDASLEVQLKSLEQHAELSLQTGLILILHIRDAFSEAALALEDFAQAGGRAILHCFTGGPKELEPFLGWNFYVSFSGILTYPKSHALREAASMVPAEQLLIETDAPWLPPQPFRGKRNEPALIVHTAQELARVRGLSDQEIAELTTANACRAFHIEK